MSRRLYIHKCIKIYEDSFLKGRDENGPAGSDESKLVEERAGKETFANDFFINMNNALFSGEYLYDDYTNFIEQFEDVLVNEGSAFSLEIRASLIHLKVLIFKIKNKIKADDGNLILSLTSRKALNNNQISFPYLSDWLNFSINLAYIDHTLINTIECISSLTNILCEVDSKMKGLDQEGPLYTIYEKLKSKGSLLLSKALLQQTDHNQRFSVNFEIKYITEIVSEDLYNKDFFELSAMMYSNKKKKIDECLVSPYEKKFTKGEFSSKVFVILAFYYGASSKKSLTKLNKIKKEFSTYYEKQIKNASKFDEYALNSIKNYIGNTCFSVKLKNKKLSIEDLQKELSEIEEIQCDTKIKNYHPYKKALNFIIDNFIEIGKKQNNNKELEDLFSSILDKYRAAREWCQQRCFYPIQLTREDCKTEDGIFIASSFSKPISPDKLIEKEEEYKEKKQFFKLEILLENKEKEIENIANKLNSFRKESFQYMGIFVAVTTFLFGGLQLFGKNQADLNSTLTNIFSIGIVLAIFMALLYVVLYCEKCRVMTLIIFIVLCFAILFFLKLSNSGYCFCFI